MPPFRPNVTIALHRTRDLTGNTAKFSVPLWFSKLDLRDYLFHVYDVRILSVRSYVQQQRVQEGDGELSKPQPNRWHRPRAKKFMTVELESPFVWPEEPESYDEQWNKNQYEDAEKGNEDYSKQTMASDKDTWVNKERREKMKEQAAALLEGRVRWKPNEKMNTGNLVSRWD
jgi:large subunit ribosomal protein L23